MKKKVFIAIIILVIIGAFIAFKMYSKIYHSNVKESTFIYIPSDTSFEAVQNLIKPYVENLESFIWVAEKKNYPNIIR